MEQIDSCLTHEMRYHQRLEIESIHGACRSEYQGDGYSRIHVSVRVMISRVTLIRRVWCYETVSKSFDFWQYILPIFNLLFLLVFQIRLSFSLESYHLEVI